MNLLDIFPGIRSAKAAIQAALTFTMAWWSYVFINRHDILLTQSFAGFRKISEDQYCWAVIFGGVAVIGFYGLISRRNWAELFSSYVLSVAYCGIAMLFFAVVGASDEHINTAQGVYFSNAFLGIYLCWRRFFK